MKLKSNPHRVWQLFQIRSFVNNAKDSVGGVIGWNYLSYSMQDALISTEVLRIVLANDHDSLPIQSIRCLYQDMREVAGLNETQEA